MKYFILALAILTLNGCATTRVVGYSDEGEPIVQQEEGFGSKALKVFGTILSGVGKSMSAPSRETAAVPVQQVINCTSRQVYNTVHTTCY